MNALESATLDTCLVDIIEQLKAGVKFKALIIKKRVLRQDVVDDVFEGRDKEENSYNFVKELRKQTSSVVQLFIEALEESGQVDLAGTLKKTWESSKDVLRSAVKEAVSKSSESQCPGSVPIDEEYRDMCCQFARGETDIVPGELKYSANPKNYACISKECALELIRHLGGKIEATLARRNNGLVVAYEPDGEVVQMQLRVRIMNDNEHTARNIWWVRPSFMIGNLLIHYLKVDHQRLTDANGQNVDTRKDFGEWWPTAPLGPSGCKELQVWVKPAAEARYIKPVKR